MANTLLLQASNRVRGGEDFVEVFHSLPPRERALVSKYVAKSSPVASSAGWANLLTLVALQREAN